MLWEHERDYGLGMDALVIVCSWNTKEILGWAWMLRGPYALSEHERNYGLGMDALVIVCSWNTYEIIIWG